MSNPVPNPQVESWLQQGIDAARAGDNATARPLLERVVEHDQHSEKGWFWLAAVVDTVDEKRICLGNVLAINPDNARAQNLLQRLPTSDQAQDVLPAPGHAGGAMEADTAEELALPDVPATPATAEDRDVLPGGRDDRRQWYIVAGGSVAVVVMLLIALFVMLSGGDDQEGRTAATEVGKPPTTPVETGVPDVPVVVEPTLAPDLPPSATPVSSPLPTSQLPPTWTPVPSSTPIPAIPATVFPPAPGNIGGKIIMRSGQVPGDPANQPLIVLQLDGSNRQVITETDRGHAPAFSPDGFRIAYIKYAVGIREYILQLDNIQGTAPQPATDYWGRFAIVLEPNYPAWSPDGRLITFTAKSGSATPNLFLLSLLDPAGNNPGALQRLTEDNIAVSWPAFSPEGQRIVYAADLPTVEGPVATELRIYSLDSGLIQSLTTNGSDLVEAAPDWSPDSTQIVFHASESGSAESDIYLIAVTGTDTPQKIIDSEYNDIQPRFSPDGRHIVFSSNRSGNWDVYIYEIATQTIYQVTTATHTDVANDWGW